MLGAHSPLPTWHFLPLGPTLSGHALAARAATGLLICVLPFFHVLQGMSALHGNEVSMRLKQAALLWLVVLLKPGQGYCVDQLHPSQQHSQVFWVERSPLVFCACFSSHHPPS